MKQVEKKSGKRKLKRIDRKDSVQEPAHKLAFERYKVFAYVDIG